MVSFFARIKIFRFWPITMDYIQVFPFPMASFFVAIRFWLKRMDYNIIVRCFAFAHL